MVPHLLGHIGDLTRRTIGCVVYQNINSTECLVDPLKHGYDIALLAYIGVGRDCLRAVFPLDLADNLIALLGVDPSPYAFVGRNLLGSPQDRPVPGAYGSFVDRRHLFVPRGPTLAEGHCYDLASLELIPTAECAAGYEEAVAAAEISRLVLVGDLQQRLHAALAVERDGR